MSKPRYQNDKLIWDHKMNDYLKSERVIKGNLGNPFTNLMDICETDVKNQIKALPAYKDMDKKLDSKALLRQSKR